MWDAVSAFTDTFVTVPEKVELLTIILESDAIIVPERVPEPVKFVILSTDVPLPPFEPK